MGFVNVCRTWKLSILYATNLFSRNNVTGIKHAILFSYLVSKLGLVLCFNLWDVQAKKVK